MVDGIMYGWSLISFGLATFFTELSWFLIAGYSQTGFARPIDYDEDGNQTMGLVVNDWWPMTVVFALACWVWAFVLFKAWMDDE